MPKFFLITIFTFIAYTISANQSVKECTSIENDQERLVCYDKIFLSTNELIVIDSNSVIEIKKIEKEEEEIGDIIDAEPLVEDIEVKDSLDRNKSSKKFNFFNLENLNTKSDFIKARAESDSSALKKKFSNLLVILILMLEQEKTQIG